MPQDMTCGEMLRAFIFLVSAVKFNHVTLNVKNGDVRDRHRGTLMVMEDPVSHNSHNIAVNVRPVGYDEIVDVIDATKEFIVRSQRKDYFDWKSGSIRRRGTKVILRKIDDILSSYRQASTSRDASRSGWGVRQAGQRNDGNRRKGRVRSSRRDRGRNRDRR